MNIPDKVVTDDYFASEWTQFKNEIENAIESSGQTLAVNSVQLKQAMARFTANADAYTDSGAADAYVLNPIANSGAGTNDSPSAYINLQKARFIAGNTNTGASTVNIAGVGIKSIEKNSWGSALVAGDIVAGTEYILTFSISNDTFNLTPAEIIGGISLSGVQGDIIYHDGTNWVKRAAGTDGEFWQTKGAAADPIWFANAVASVWGVVKADGTKLSGSSNWTAARNSAGKYQLNITDAGDYMVISAHGESSSTEVVAAEHNQTTGIFINNTANNIQTRNHDLSAQDVSWVFTAIKL